MYYALQGEYYEFAADLSITFLSHDACYYALLSWYLRLYHYYAPIAVRFFTPVCCALIE